MGAAGYDEEDIFSAIKTLVEWGLLEPESLIVEGLTGDDAVRMHATGFIHMRFFVDRLEYLVGVTTDMRFASRHVAEEIGNVWAGHSHLPDLSKAATAKVLERLKTISYRSM